MQNLSSRIWNFKCSKDRFVENLSRDLTPRYNRIFDYYNIVIFSILLFQLTACVRFALECNSLGRSCKTIQTHVYGWAEGTYLVKVSL